MRQIISAVALVLVVGLWPDVAAAQDSASRYAPLVHGWEQFFRITWEPFERKGRPYLGGHISSDWGFTAMRVQILAEALDASGNVTKQTVHWLGQPIPPGSRVYFEIPAPQAAPAYRLHIFAFSGLQTASMEAP
jgi:hypothetical protein